MHCFRTFVTTAVVLLLPATVSAGSGGYFTTYDSEIDDGEVELMLMNDFTTPSQVRRDEGQRNYFSHMLELEYGITPQLAAELMLEWYEELGTGKQQYTGFRAEARYRIFRRLVPFNPMVYIEYENLEPTTRYKMEVSGWVRPPYEESESGGHGHERILESRLVLSDRLGPINLAFNWIFETDLKSGTTGFGYSLGAMWMVGHGRSVAHATEHHDRRSCAMHPEIVGAPSSSCPKCGMGLHAGSTGDKEVSHRKSVGLGLELFGGMGDTRSFALRPSRQEHYLGPILVYHVTSKVMLHAQFALGVSESSDNIARLNIGYEF